MLDTAETTTGQKIIAILAHHIYPGPDEIATIRLDDTLKDHLGIDSLDCMELAIAIEEEFDIEMMDENFDDIETVMDLIDFVDAQILEAGR